MARSGLRPCRAVKSQDCGRYFWLRYRGGRDRRFSQGDPNINHARVTLVKNVRGKGWEVLIPGVIPLVLAKYFKSAIAGRLYIMLLMILNVSKI